ncbi:kyphoscoliosis peptidase-like isoform X2 [Pleurodeles waltl]|uniref:kyphoscoliosis peptidase-like isoform X2 n=1 Tax=Pleurodeles waltl TaxID=8319 RepID=UPI00370984EE
MEVTGEVQALTFDWYLTVGADGNRKAGHEVHTVGITATSTSRQVHGTVIQSLQLSGSQEITNFNNNHVSPSTAINVTPEANVTTVRQQTPEGHVVVEVHPNNTTPSFFQKILEKGIGCKDLQLKPHEQPQTLAPTAKDLYTYPWDKSSLKSMPINLQDFQMLDAYASVVGSKSSVEDLVRALLRKAYSDLEKVRAIWIWICHHIEYDMEELRDKNRRSADPEHILRTRKGVCAGYAGLFERMCRTAGIRCVQLTGFAKGFTYEIGQTFSGESNHAWNAVYLAGSWHLVDSTWGAGFVNNTSNRFTFQYNEFYFLTHPALFADGHFPDNQNWQLLKPPLSLKQFENNIRCTSSFYTAGLVAANPETVIIETVNGKATVTLEGRSPLHFSFRLNGKESCGLMTLKKNGMKLDIFPRKTGHHMLCLYAKPENSVMDIYENVVEYIIECRSVDKNMLLPRELENPVGPSWVTKSKGFLQPSHLEPVIHTLDGRCTVTFILEKQMAVMATLHSDEIPVTEEIQRRHIFQVEEQNKIQFRVQIPKAGLYVLKIFGESSLASEHFEYVCNYILSCKNTDVHWPPFPEELHNPVGPSFLMEEKGFLQPSHMDPIIFTTDGRCSMSFSLEQDIDILAHLYYDDIPLTKDIERRHILQAQTKNKVELRVQLPQAGMYVLKIYSDSHRSGDFEYVGNYLICCTNERVKWPPFPLKLQNPVGPSSLMEEKGLLQPSQREPIIYTVDGRCSVSFTLEKDINFLALLHDEMNITEENERTHILQVQCENRIEFKIQLPKASTYVLRIYAETKSNTGHFEYICNYLVCCTNLDVHWPAFPSMLENPVGPCRLMEKYGLFQPSHSEPIIYTTDGRCSISFSLSKKVHLFARLHSDDITMSEDFGRRHVLLIQKENSITFEVQIPQTGSYVLKIYAEHDKGHGKTCFVCNYLLCCPNTGVRWPAFPEDLRSPVGPNWSMENRGVFKPSNTEPIIYAVDGSCSINFTLAENVTIMATLHSDDITTERIKRRHIFPVYKENNVEFKIRLPQAGLYVLKVYAKKKSDPNNLYEFLCNYLVRCTNTQVKWPAFPQIYCTWASNYELEEPLAGVLPANSNVYFKLRAKGAAGVSIKGKYLFPLSLNNEGFWVGTFNTTGSQNVYVQVTKNLNKSYSSVLGYHVESEAEILPLFHDKTKMDD